MEPKFDAFISYKHVVSSEFARDFEVDIKRFARSRLTRPRRIFRDEQHMLPGQPLGDSIAAALRASNYLILLASPEAAASTWVRDELTIWCGELHRADRVIIVLTGGEIAVDSSGQAIDWSRTTALPRLLEKYVRHLPLWVDATQATSKNYRRLNNPPYYSAVASVAAVLQGVELNILIGKEWQVRRRTLMAAWTAAVLLALLAVGLGTLSIMLSASVHTSRSRELAATSRLQVRGDRLKTASEAVRQRATTEAIRALLDAHVESRSLLWETQIARAAVESLAVSNDQVLVVVDNQVVDVGMRLRVRKEARLVATAPDGALWYAGKMLASDGRPLSRLAATPTSLSVGVEMIVVGFADGVVAVRSSGDASLSPLHNHSYPVTKVQTAAGWVVSTALDPATPVKLWHKTYGSLDLPDPPFTANAGAIAPNGKFVSIAFEDGTIGVWALPSLLRVHIDRLDQSATATAWRDDSACVAFGTSAGKVLILRENFDVVDRIDAVSGGVWAMAWSGRDLITTGSDGAVRAWRPGETVGPVSRHPKPPTAAKVVVAAPSGLPALVRLDDKLQFDFGNGKSAPVPMPVDCRLHTAVLSPSGRFAILNWRPRANEDAQCRATLYELANSLASPLPHVPEWVSAIAFYGDQRVAVTDSRALGGGVRIVLWRVAGTELIHDELLQIDPVEAIAFHGPDALLLGGLRGSLTLHTLDGQEIRSSAPVGAVRDILVLDDGTIIASDVDGVRWYDANLALRGILLDTSRHHESVWAVHPVPGGRAIRLDAQGGDIIEVSLSLPDWLASAESKVREPPN